MNKRVKKLWIADLRSGEIEQGKRCLRDDKDRRCCLAVLCDVFKRDTGKGVWRRNKDGDWEFIVEGERASMTLPRPVQKWASVEDDNPFLGSDLAASLNDEGQSFEYIADRIEKYL